MSRPLRRLFLVFTVLFASCTARAELPTLADGDLIFQVSRSGQSLAIQHATRSQWSHMGVIVHRDGKPYVFEASATVRYTPLKSWVDRGEGKRFVAKRLKNASTVLTPAVLKKARQIAAQFMGKPYDLTFEWSDQRMYCSELVWKLYDRALGVQIGALQKLRDFHLDDLLVRKKLRERYGDRVPLDESVISPAAMFDSDLLEVVAQR